MMERRQGKFTERLSIFMCVVAALGAAAVLLDPKITFTFWSDTASVAIGGDGFSADLKGAVITAILISGWTAVKEYWLGASDAGKTQSESISRIAEASAPVAAAAAAAAIGAPITTDDVQIDATGANINIEGEKK